MCREHRDGVVEQLVAAACVVQHRVTIRGERAAQYAAGAAPQCMQLASPFSSVQIISATRRRQGRIPRAIPSALLQCHARSGRVTRLAAQPDADPGRRPDRLVRDKLLPVVAPRRVERHA